MTQLADKSTHMANFTRPPEPAGIPAPPWLQALRKTGIDRFDLVGFPNKRQEEWRQTDVSAIARTAFRHLPAGVCDSAAALARKFSFGKDAACELVFVNGHFARELSHYTQLPHGVRVDNLTDALADDRTPLVEQHLGQYADVEKNPFVALNTGFIRDGARIYIPRGAVVANPIHMLFVSSPGDGPSVAHPRLLVVADNASQCTVVESYVGESATAYFTNAVTEIVAGSDALIDHCKLQQEGPEAFHVATMQVHLGRGAKFVSHSASIGSRLTRNDLNVVLNGEGADATLNGLVLAGGRQHIDNHTLLDHAYPNCPSHELYKHVLNGKSVAVFKGKILVRQPAQKTDSKQSSKALMLSDDAVMNSMPALEIYADDVKCTHGSSTGPVDEDQVFYLRTRGVGLEAARHLMTYAFAADITRRIRVEPVRRRLEEYMAGQHGLPLDLRITDLGAHDEAVRQL
ncbi:MAG TPA: Fe-S cluster assembly protein SufD [Tepidisphaeraceae bacterium]|jgi:Fe-S cluster assembly protein SufD|nr:Fe-S cluster assembly protein SufD [Tepidisphaeraceae bacterium]